MMEFEFELPSINLYNTEVGIGMKLLIEENNEDGIFTLRYSFPEQWYPKIQEYNRY